MNFIVQAKSPDSTYKVIVYEHTNYEGRSQTLPVGRYNMAQLTIGNDIISSIKIPDGVMVTAYEHADFKGAEKVFTSDTSHVGNDFNDKISSIVVELAVKVYEHENYGGKSQTLPLGSYDMSKLAIGNDIISSVKVPSGLMVTLFEHSNFQGRTKSYTQDTTFVGTDFNDITSAILVSLAEIQIPDKALKFGDIISLGSSHGKYMVAESDGNLNANRDAIGAWEKFVIVRSGNTKNDVFVSFGDIISLKSWDNKYVVAEDNGAANVNRTEIGDWEKFTLIRSGNTQSENFFCSDDIITLKSWKGQFVVAEDNGTVNSNRTEIGDWEKWKVVVSANDNKSLTAKDIETAACGADACGAAACGAAACGAAACGAAVYGLVACGVAACAADACVTAVCAGDVCGGQACAAAACGGAACGGAACGGAACGGAACGADACGGYAGGFAACPADACGANVCGINACPADACAADACAIDVIPIIPGI